MSRKIDAIEIGPHSVPTDILRFTRRRGGADLALGLSLFTATAAVLIGGGTLLSRLARSRLSGRVRGNQLPVTPAVGGSVNAEANGVVFVNSATDLDKEQRDLSGRIKDVLSLRKTDFGDRSWNVVHTKRSFHLWVEAPRGLREREIPSKLGQLIPNHTPDGKLDPIQPYRTFGFQRYLGSRSVFVVERAEKGEVLGVWIPVSVKPIADKTQEFVGVYDSGDPQQLVIAEVKGNEEAMGISQQVPLKDFLQEMGILIASQPVTPVLQSKAEVSQSLQVLEK